jgi:ribose 5-phosphate isomerase A
LSGGAEVAFRKIAEEISKDIKDGTVLGMGSGSTAAGVLHELARILASRRVDVEVVPTSLQIQMVAEKEGFHLVSFTGSVDIVIDGADQIDADLNMIKGGGGALLKEKILMSSSRKNNVVAGREKFVPKLGDNAVKVPVEVSPFAKDIVKKKLADLGGQAEERLLAKGYPFFTENGNIILDTKFPLIDDPRALEVTVDALPGVVESGIFTIKPVRVFKIGQNGDYEVLSR